MMSHEQLLGRAIRTSWPLLGGAWGAWVGFRPMLFYLPIENRDTFAPVFLWGFAVFCALIGALVGSAVCTLVDRLVERFLRNFNVTFVAALIMASLVNVLAIWKLTDFFEENYTGVRYISKEQSQRTTIPTTPPAAGKDFSCSDPRPTGRIEGIVWDSECQ